jgi:hypothetical protein
MTFSNKFTSLDNREAALLDDMRPDQREIFEKICADYDAEFRPETDMERDTVYCLATLRWGIERIRAVEQETRESFVYHGYIPPKVRAALDELLSYQKELQIRYEYFFSHLIRMQGAREAA